MVNHLRNLKASNSIPGSISDRMSLADIYKVYTDLTKQSSARMSNAEKQDIYKFCQNLRFREDNRTVSVDDFADLVYRQTEENPRLRRIDHYPYPSEPLDRDVEITPKLTEKKYTNIMENLNEKMALKRVSSYDHFKIFDKDNDGLIKQHDFESVLGKMNIATKDEAGEIFQKLK